ncbi:MAG: GspE/PulE family protein [Candidatus Omnitrophica bacterium]|nr:GspE/PulE family protein [Candidatus Omnitrophota bacterium]
MNDKELESLLLSQNILSQESLNKALDEMRKLKRPLEKIIVEMKLLPRKNLYESIAKHFGFNYVSLDGLQPNEQIVKLMPEALAVQTQSVPIRIENGILHLAMSEPSDLFAIDQIQMQTGLHVEAYLAAPEEIDEARGSVYAKRSISEDMMTTGFTQGTSAAKASMGEGASIIKLVDLIIAQAVHDRASDIHIEPEQELTRIRFRIDGILHEVPSPPKDWEPAIISRIKVLSGMDIAENRIPQDGHFQSKVEEKIIDFRISTMPTIYGENVVMRILDTASVTIGLEKLGFSTTDQLTRYEGLISKPYGIILSTGPTGSGKTTTLYSALMRINTIDRNIITIEDPVEYRLGLIRQIQVNAKAGITFANGLRAMLRQDPDVIMVGEIRDIDTAVIAIQAALTGHLVFSTLHTNDAPSAITRLINMGVEPFLISASLIGVMAQRLIRVVCEHCKEPYEPSKALIDKWGIKDRKNARLYRGKGCDYCKGTGFRGRSGIFELMSVDDEIREMIISGASTVSLRRKCQAKGMKLLSEDGLNKALSGVTTIEEVARVCEEHTDLKPASEEAAAEAEVKPMSQAPLSSKTAEQVQVKPADITEYEKRIASWLGEKK